MNLKTLPRQQRLKKEKPGLSQRLKMTRTLFKRDWQLHLLILVPLIYIAIFQYGPMYGAQIAFRDYRPKLGITGSEFVGFQWFEKFLTYYDFWEIFANTVILSMYSLIIGFVLALMFALLLNTMQNEKLKKFTQTISYMPHFISVVVIVAMLKQVLSPVNGLYGGIYRLLGNEGYPTDIRGLATSFRHLYVWSGVWQNLGWDTIIYVAALSAVSPDLHEAAMIDGASRWKRIWSIDLPTILPTACIMLIMRSGSIMSVGFEKVFLLQSSLNLETSEVISTYVYKIATGSSRDFSYGSAIGLFNSVANCAILIFVNWISQRLSDREVGLF